MKKYPFKYVEISKPKTSPGWLTVYLVSLVLALYLAFLSFMYWFLAWGWLPMIGMVIVLVIAYKSFKRI